MSIEWKAYQRYSLPGDELCLAAAFLGLPCLYGVPGEWIRRSREGLKGRILGIIADLERRRILLPEPGGTVRMDQGLYGMVDIMGRASRIGRICFGTGSGQRCIYLYRKEESLVCMEPDAGGRCLLGQLPSVAALKEALHMETESTEGAAGADAGKGEVSPGVGCKKGEWMGALVFEEKTDRFFERVYDMAWEQGMGKDALSSGWNRLCEILENGNLEIAAGR